ncbi:DUF1104 domain-containing protein [Helicobacter cappadocius]|uniref:DUF1104 domain-containing protein n=1 Tax=Helicobacter cappadocius TaxID=3063998 RepID=A0AA90PX52_9HELI|nr:MULTISPECIES: DUF1104 domain-containing protein [unclassified Helicobacter]MDO7252336.1 DUF1104 domain-containing protein [Helicobacter sp. faydin-H75]MDP2538203.1 DUF1104 domain-containing protein [Helicobacter sp. faydin-H76]
MNKFISMILAGALCASLAFGADFSKKSNDDLIKVAGTVAPKDVPDYRMELHKRIKAMKKPEAKAFHEKLEASMKKNTEKMSMKDMRARREAIKKAIDEKTKGMTKEQIKESGLDHHGHHKHGKDHKKDEGSKANKPVKKPDPKAPAPKPEAK